MILTQFSMVPLKAKEGVWSEKGTQGSQTALVVFDFLSWVVVKQEGTHTFCVS